MKPFCIIFLILSLFSLELSFAQSNIDSLEQLYHQSSIDTIRARVANEIAFYNLRSDIKKGEKYALSALEISEKANYTIGIISAYNNLGNFSYLKGNFQTSISYFDKAIEEGIQSNINTTQQKVSKAGVLQTIGKLDTAIFIYKEAILYFDSTEQYRFALVALNNLAIVYSRQGQYKNALTLYEKGYGYAVILKDSSKMGSVKTNIGNSYFDMGDNTLAVEHWLGALEIFESIDDKRGQSIALNSIGNQYVVQKQPQKALKYLEQAGELKKSLNYRISYAKTLMLEGDAYNQLEQTGIAIKKLKEALSIQQEVQDVRSIAETQFSLGTILLKREELEKGLAALKASETIALQNNQKALLSNIYLKYAEVINQGNILNVDQNSIDISTALQKAEVYLNETDNLRNAQEIYLARANWEASQGHFKIAYRYQNLLSQVKDSLYTKEKVRAFEEMKTKFETSKKEQENILLLAENEHVARQNQIYLWGLFSTFLGMGLLTYLYRNLKKTKDKLSQQNQLVATQNEELIALNHTKDRFFSIIAHDLRSPIAAFQGVGSQINYFLKKKSFDRLAELGEIISHSSIQLSNLLDNLLNWALTQTGNIPYKPKLLKIGELVEDIVELFEGATLAKEISVAVKVDATHQIYADERAVNTILRNLLNNAVKYSNIGSTIYISTENHKTQLKLEIKDNGVGMDEKQLAQLFSINKQSQKGTSGESGTGLGLVLCKELLSANGGSLDVNSKLGKGAIFSVYLPNASR